MKRFTRVGGFLALFAIVVAAASAAGAGAATRKAPPPSPLTPILKQVAGKSPAQREAILLDLAKKEGGKLTWYTSLSKTIGPGVVSAFEARYPGIKVDMYRASSEDLTAKLTQEASAGATSADVVESNGTELTFYQHKKNILVPYRGSPYAKAVPAQYRFDTWTGDRLEAFTLAWNTNLVPSGQPPSSWEDLADPKWAGKLAMEPGDVDWFAAVYQYQEAQALKGFKPRGKTKKARLTSLARQTKKVDAKLNALWSSIAKNSQIVSGHTTQATLLAAGQFAVCVSCHAQSLEALIKKKAPVSFHPFAAPEVIRAQGVAIAYRLAHPATAMLFYDWMLMPDGGQKALLDGGANPSLPSMADPDLAGAQKVLLDLRPVVSHFKAWADRYDAIVRLGTPKG